MATCWILALTFFGNAFRFDVAYGDALPVALRFDRSPYSVGVFLCVWRFEFAFMLRALKNFHWRKALRYPVDLYVVRLG